MLLKKQIGRLAGTVISGLFKPLDSRDGNVALIFALMAPLLMAAVGMGIDFQVRLSQRAGLQDAADGLALRGAREMLLENAQGSTIEALIQALAEKQYAPSLGQFSTSPSVDQKNASATVTLSQPSRNGFFLSHLVPHEDPIIVHATAVAKGVTNVCLIALEQNADDAISASSIAKLQAPKCALLSNSKSSRGITVNGLAHISAGFICSAGGAVGGSLNLTPAPVTDCPIYEDPIAGRPEPIAGGCDYSNLVVGVPPTLNSFLLSVLESTVSAIDGSFTGTLIGYDRVDLEPGVYCGGLTINDKSDAHLAPGIYIIKDGPLIVRFGARIIGDGVGFFLDGDASTFTFEPASIIHLSAPVNGLSAGLLFWESKAAPENRNHWILSSNARELLGTIYLPRGILTVKSAMPIADQSAYTAIVAKRFITDGGPTVVLNSNYSATNVPVPDGVGPTGGMVYLRE